MANLIPLSHNQEFLCGFDRGDQEGPFGPRFHIVHGWRLRGPLDVGTLREALRDVVVRHETLRTVIERDVRERGQRVMAASTPDLEVRELSAPDDAVREQQVDELINEVEAGTIDARRLPLLRAVLGRFDGQDSVLVLMVHHTATDGWSVRLIIRDLAACYAARRGYGVVPPEVPPYREFAVWQRENADSAGVTVSRAAWRKRLDGARIFSLPTDRPKSAGLPESTAVYRFLIDAEVVGPALRVARALRSTPFMVLFAAFVLLARGMAGDEDIVMPTFSPGRGEERFQGTVGPFFNFLPLRTDLAGCRSFAQIVERVRATCLEAYAHDIPFAQIVGEAPELMLPTLQDDRATCVIQVFPFPFLLDGEKVGDLEYSEVRRRLTSQPVGSDVPNGALWTLNLDPSGDVVASIQYNSNLFDESTMADMAARYVRVLGEIVGAPDGPLGR